MYLCHGKFNLKREHAIEFLQSLQDHFSSMRSQIPLIKPFSSTQRTSNLVKQEESQQLINIGPPQSIEYVALQIKEGYAQTFNGPSNNKR